MGKVSLAELVERLRFASKVEAMERAADRSLARFGAVGGIQL
jgi:hypothetical protein